MNFSDQMPFGLSLVAATETLRTHIGRLYRCANTKSIILCPGQLIGICHLLHAFHGRSIVLTDEEYYTPNHFPGIRVSICKPEEVARIAVRDRPDAVLMSMVSWKGRVLPVQREFRRIRVQATAQPLLICDYAHAGAVGFPRFDPLHADIICGDLHKWVFPREHEAQIAFLWAGTHKLQKEIVRIFRGYYLAGESGVSRAARWISPHDLASAALWLRTAKPTRSALRKQYRCNLAQIRDIASELGLPPPTASRILWVPEFIARRKAQQLRTRIARGDVEVWRVAHGWRIVSCTDRP